MTDTGILIQKKENQALIPFLTLRKESNLYQKIKVDMAVYFCT
jgi:hypothetical protein